jgi:hypothetical protein
MDETTEPVVTPPPPVAFVEGKLMLHWARDLERPQGRTGKP